MMEFSIHCKLLHSCQCCSVVWASIFSPCTFYVTCYPVPFQHPFLKKANALDKAAICNLINESKAEVVELVEDLNEEDDISHMKVCCLIQ